MLDAVEPIPAQLSAAVDGDRPGPRSVVDEVAFRGAVVVDVEYGVVGNVVAVEVGQRVIAQTVAVEIQANRVQPAVTVEVDVERAVPDPGAAVVAGYAVLRNRSDATPKLAVPP